MKEQNSIHATSERTINNCESFRSKLNTNYSQKLIPTFLYLDTYVLNTKIPTDTYIYINGININTISVKIVKLTKKMF